MVHTIPLNTALRIGQTTKCLGHFAIRNKYSAKNEESYQRNAKSKRNQGRRPGKDAGEKSNTTTEEHYAANNAETIRPNTQ